MHCVLVNIVFLIRDVCAGQSFPLKSLRSPEIRRLKWKQIPAFESVSLFIYSEPQIVDTAFAIEFFISYMEIGLFPVSKRGIYKIKSHNKNSAESPFPTDLSFTVFNFTLFFLAKFCWIFKIRSF